MQNGGTKNSKDHYSVTLSIYENSRLCQAVVFYYRKKTACVFLSSSFLIKIIERMEDCYSHTNTYLQYGKCRLSRLHTVTLRHRLPPEKEETRSSMDVLQNQCSQNFHKIHKKTATRAFFP